MKESIYKVPVKKTDEGFEIYEDKAEKVSEKDIEISGDQQIRELTKLSNYNSEQIAKTRQSLKDSPSGTESFIYRKKLTDGGSMDEIHGGLE